MTNNGWYAIKPNQSKATTHEEHSLGVMAMKTHHQMQVNIIASTHTFRGQEGLTPVQGM